MWTPISSTSPDPIRTVAVGSVNPASSITAVRTVGIVSGGAPSQIGEAVEMGLDVYVTGESSLWAYNLALQEGIQAIDAELARLVELEQLKAFAHYQQVLQSVTYVDTQKSTTNTLPLRSAPL